MIKLPLRARERGRENGKEWHACGWRLRKQRQQRFSVEIETGRKRFQITE
jgi:hypothetical protein